MYECGVGQACGYSRATAVANPRPIRSRPKLDERMATGQEEDLKHHFASS